MTQASFSSSQYQPDQLLAGETPPVSRKVTILDGQDLTRGAVLGKITASGKYILSLSAAGDGSEVPDAILAEDATADGADAEAMAYFRADVNENSLTIGTGHTAASIREGLRAKGIFLIPATATE